jgi:hypothetical protein
MKRALFLFIYVLCIAGGAVVVWLGISSVRNELHLRDKPAVADAKITDASTYVTTQNNIESTDYEVRYAFTVPGHSETFTHADETSRKDLWATLTNKSDWEAARAAGGLQVVYLPENPWVNRPVLAGNAPLGDSAAGLALGGVLALVGIIGALVIVQRMRAKR